MANDDEETTLEMTKKRSLLDLNQYTMKMMKYYQAFVPNSFQYDAVTKTIAKGLSFHQIIGVDEEYQDMTKMTCKLGNIYRQKVTMLVQLFCAESLQRIAETTKFCWVFAITLYGGNKA